MDAFHAYSRYYNLLYQDKNYAGEADYIHNLLSTYGIKKGDLLEFGSGTGKHGRLLVEKGYTVHGIERSKNMVAESALIPGFTCQQGDICEVKLAKKYNAVLSLFHVLSYQVTNSQVLAVFKNAASHLIHGGLFIFDFWYSPAVYTIRPSVRIKRIEDDKTEITRIAEPVIHSDVNMVDVNYSIYARDKITGETRNLREKHSMRHFSLPEIDLLGRITGFKMLLAEELLTKTHPSCDVWGVCVTLQKDKNE